MHGILLAVHVGGEDCGVTPGACSTCPWNDHCHDMRLYDQLLPLLPAVPYSWTSSPHTDVDACLGTGPAMAGMSPSQPTLYHDAIQPTFEPAEPSTAAANSEQSSNGRPMGGAAPTGAPAVPRPQTHRSSSAAQDDPHSAVQMGEGTRTAHATDPSPVAITAVGEVRTQEHSVRHLAVQRRGEGSAQDGDLTIWNDLALHSAVERTWNNPAVCTGHVEPMLPGARGVFAHAGSATVYVEDVEEAMCGHGEFEAQLESMEDQNVMGSHRHEQGHKRTGQESSAARKGNEHPAQLVGLREEEETRERRDVVRRAGSFRGRRWVGRVCVSLWPAVCSDKPNSPRLQRHDSQPFPPIYLCRSGTTTCCATSCPSCLPAPTSSRAPTPATFCTTAAACRSSVRRRHCRLRSLKLSWPRFPL